MDFCLIFVTFGHYDETEILPYENPSICPKGADVRQVTIKYCPIPLGTPFLSIRLAEKPGGTPCPARPVVGLSQPENLRDGGI
jgi:hypothetical protein